MKKRKPLPKNLRYGGAVIEEYKKCGKANCRCVSGLREDLHGPYYYRFFRDLGTLRREYIPRHEAAERKQECDKERETKRALRTAVSASRSRLRGLMAWLRGNGGPP